MEKPVYLPTLSHWEYGNPWSGDRGEARYLIKSDGSVMSAELWRGPSSREFAQPLYTREFPVSQEGIEDLRAWILQCAQELSEGEESHGTEV